MTNKELEQIIKEFRKAFRKLCDVWDVRVGITATNTTFEEGIEIFWQVKQVI